MWYIPGQQPLHTDASEAPTVSEYIPGAHRSQVDLLIAPKAAENVPATQGSHVPCPGSSWYVPASQSTHAELFVAPTDGCCFPGGHAVQFDAATIPKPDEYVPAPHGWHAVSAICLSNGWYLPGPHRSHADVLASAVEYAPALHARQSAGAFPVQAVHPCIVLYVPAGHATHDPASGPKYPALHVQSASSSDDSEELAFWGQLSLMPTTQYDPPGHCWHTTSPTPCVPFGQRHCDTEGDSKGEDCLASGHDAMWPPPRQYLF